VSVNVGQTAIDTVLTVDQSLVVDAQQMQYRGVEVVSISLAFGRLIPPFVTATVAGTRFDAGTGQPCDK
jgi:hypothetical protein